MIQKLPTPRFVILMMILEKKNLKNFIILTFDFEVTSIFGSKVKFKKMTFDLFLA